MFSFENLLIHNSNEVNEFNISLEVIIFFLNMALEIKIYFENISSSHKT